jgi:hypothetical protein
VQEPRQRLLAAIDLLVRECHAVDHGWLAEDAWGRRADPSLIKLGPTLIGSRPNRLREWRRCVIDGLCLEIVFHPWPRKLYWKAGQLERRL